MARPRTKTQSVVFKDKTYHQIGTRSTSLMLKTRHDDKNPLLYFDEAKRKQRPLRYCTNQDSPFIDEQEGEAIVGRVNLVDGVLQVPKENQALQKFLEVTPENGVKFEEFDPNAKAQEEVVIEKLKFEAKSYIFNSKANERKGVCKVLNGGKVDNYQPDEVIQSLLVTANTKPQTIIDLFEDEDLTDLILATDAIDQNILTITGDRLMNGKDVVLEIPFGKEPKDILKSYFKTKEGAMLKAFVKKSLA